jgi:exosome complex component RRP4
VYALATFIPHLALTSLQCEVQQFYGDGSMALHTRSLKYGKLRDGAFVAVAPSLVKRAKTHFQQLPCGVHVLLGNNGYIWVSPPLPEVAADPMATDDAAPLEALVAPVVRRLG